MATRSIFDNIVIKKGNEFLDKLAKPKKSKIDKADKDIKSKQITAKKEIEKILKGC